MSKQFNEDGTYNKTDWKAGDKITATKLNKIEDAIEAVNNNDISRHEETDARLDALESSSVSDKKELEDKLETLEDTVVANKDAADLGIYNLERHMTLLDQKIDDGVDTVEAIAHTVDEKIADADASMKAQVAEAEDIVDQGKADINAIIDECEKISDLEAINEQLENIGHYIELTPDYFKGTDCEKVQQAFDFCVTNNYKTINLNRVYDITGGTIYLPSTDFWQFITFTNGKIIKNDAGFMFDSQGKGENRGAPKFVGVIFETTSDDVYVINGNKMLRQFFDNCVFRKVGAVITQGGIQTLRLHNCEIGELGCNFIEAYGCYDFEILHCRFETTGRFNAIKIQMLKENNTISFYNLRIISTLFEGYTNTTPIILGSGYGLSITNCYFEANKTSIILNNLGSSARKISGVIEQNTFGHSYTDYDIEILDILNCNKLYIQENTTDNSKYLCSKYLLKEGIDTNNYVDSKASFSIPPQSVNIRGYSYEYIQTSLGDKGTMFEIKIPLKNYGGISYLSNKQFLLNVKCTYQNSAVYSAHVLGFISLDGCIQNGVLTHTLLFKEISTRNTSGGGNGSLDNPSNYDIYFKETGNQAIPSDTETCTIVVELPACKFDTTYNKCILKNLEGIIQDFYIDTEN